MGGDSKSPCAVCGHKDRRNARGLCPTHYMQAKRRGKLPPPIRKPGFKHAGAACLVCPRQARVQGRNGPLCVKHYCTEWTRIKRGRPPLVAGEVVGERYRIPIPEGEPCFACGRTATDRGTYVYLCRSHYRLEGVRSKRMGRPAPFGTELDMPPDFRGRRREDEAADEAKIDRILAERRALLDDREKPRALDPWFQRSSMWD